ncbi:hypothetical protein HN371_01345 [Candidatus Poribacteria bacterium]|jgi:hypothetical protein|nr:hypothetical protein [Candidatus Poribacteria bacterium]MBT5533736.1 hypothetical protein [Candidatus Poribacteria bacterium]MBT5713007.1 hypothetical protein [Candidatus Poribacteria bacterium]MBT7096188.1 hypothetical protein [Candidatus Poribacteria bacterium]MBT7804224.1 hypothetical protein [Candidatus Poribacteria bacterium]
MFGRFVGSALMCLIPAFLVGGIVGGLVGGGTEMFEPDITDEEAAELTAMEFLQHTFKPGPPATPEYRIAFTVTFLAVFTIGVWWLMWETRPYDRRVGPTGDVVRVARRAQLRA